jgi:hypothetical protein
MTSRWSAYLFARIPFSKSEERKLTVAGDVGALGVGAEFGETRGAQEDVLVVLAVPALVVDVEEGGAVFGVEDHLYVGDAPDVLGVADVESLACLDGGDSADFALLADLVVLFLKLAELLRVGLLGEHLLDQLVDEGLPDDALAPDVGPTDGTHLNVSGLTLFLMSHSWMQASQKWWPHLTCTLSTRWSRQMLHWKSSPFKCAVWLRMTAVSSN